MTTATASSTSRSLQFGIRSLLEFTALAAGISAMANTIGIMAAAALFLFLTAITLRQGWLAIVMLVGASIAADVRPPRVPADLVLIPQVIVFGVATLACLWRRHRAA